jgi:predicted extracellular nuclease
VTKFSRGNNSPVLARRKFATLIEVTILVSLLIGGGILIVHAGKDPKIAPSKGTIAAATPASAVTPSNLLVYRVGDGAAALGTTAAAVFLDEYTPSGTLVQSIALPTSGGSAVTAVGNATTEGAIAFSQDGSALIFTGYRKASGGTSPASDSYTTTPRVIGTLKLDGTLNTTTTLSNDGGSTSANTIRSATSVDGTTAFWTSTSTRIGYDNSPFAAGGTTQIDARNSRQVLVRNNIVYASNGSTTITAKVQSYGNLPTGATAGTAVVTLASADAVHGMEFFDLSAGVSGPDTLYVLSTVEGFLRKYTYNGTSWAASGSINVGTTYVNLSGTANGGNVTLYLTNGTTLSQLTDTSGYGGTLSGSLSSVATAGTNKAFRGVALIPATGNQPSNPSGSGAANPNVVVPGGSTLLTVTVTPGTNPTSTGLAVTGDLTAIGGSPTQQFFDDGTNGDDTGGDNIFSFDATVPGNTSLGLKNIPFAISDAQSRSGSGNITLTVQTASGATPIDAIQGATCNTPNCVTISPFNGQAVTTSGVVTARKSNGFFIQTPDDAVDADPTTSEGIFVFTSSAPPATAAVGNMITVTGTVSEFRPSSDPNSPPETELTGPTVGVVSTGNLLPSPVTLTTTDLNPNNFENLEKYEGMRVHVDSLTVCGPTEGSVNEPNATSTSFGTFYGVITGTALPFVEPGIQLPDPVPTPSPSGTPAPNVPRWDTNPEHMRINSIAQTGATDIEASVGAVVTNVTGPLDFQFRSYMIDIDPSPTPGVTPGMSAIAVPTPTANEFTVGNFNMERFFDTVNDGNGAPVLTATAFNNRLNKGSLAIRNMLRSPDILGVEEIENIGALTSLATKINNDEFAASGINPNYHAYLVEGNDVGGIDVGFLVKESRVTTIDVTQFGKTATYVEPNGTTATLNDRPPLVLRATLPRTGGGTQPVTVIVNHLRSLSGINGTDGARIRAKRKAQAEYLANLIQARQIADPTENIISVGDYNAFSVNDGFVDVMATIRGTPTPADQVVLASSDLVNPDLTPLLDTLPASARYSYTFDGNHQAIDHQLINGQLARRFNRFAVAHFDAEFPDSLRNDPNRPERISDHDAEVSYYDLSANTRQRTRADFTGDRTTDVSLFRSSDGTWSVLDNNGTVISSRQWGMASDKLVPGDYDGDFKTDFAVYRPSEGNWYVVNSSSGAFSITGWGTSADIPVPGDYDRDNKTDLAVFRPSEGNWYILNSSGGSITVRNWGASSDIPVPGDYDGDGKTDVAVYRPSEGNWYIINSSTGTSAIQSWGNSSDKLVPADYDGDGKTDIAIFRPSEGNWYILNSGGGVTVRGWGAATDKLVPADYDGDGKTDIAVYRPSEGNWYVVRSSDGGILLINSDSTGDVPIPSAMIP